MTTRRTRQGCQVTTTYQRHENGTLTENVTLECTPDLQVVKDPKPGRAMPDSLKKLFGDIRLTK